jgi:hypothetical protein
LPASNCSATLPSRSLTKPPNSKKSNGSDAFTAFRPLYSLYRTLLIQELSAHYPIGLEPVFIEKIVNQCIKGESKGSDPFKFALNLRQLEATFSGLHRTFTDQQKAQAICPKTVLHVGPGHRQSGAKLPSVLHEFKEV